MDYETWQSRVDEGFQASSSRVKTNFPCDNETTYWGICCRTCATLVAFDVCPYVSFGPASASMRPGAIRCTQGHNHIYFPRDFRFLSSAVCIPDADMQQNRDTYKAVNPVSLVCADSQ